MADLVTDFIAHLAKAKGDPHALSAFAAEFALGARPNAEQEPLRVALDVAAVLHWFDEGLLLKMLDITDEEARKRFKGLKALPFVEHYRRGKHDLRNVHESTRLGWRKQLAHEQPERFAYLSAKAAACFADDFTPAGRIEWIYHLLCGDPEHGATELESLDRNWSGCAHPEDRYALSATLRELEDTGLVQGRARVWVLLAIAWARVSRDEAAQLAEVTLNLAQAVEDRRAESDARCLLGDVLQTQGKLEAAQEAYGEYLAISRHLAEQDPSNAGWQRELAVAQGRVGEVLQAQGKLEAAQEAFGECLAISRRLAEQEPGNAGWQRELAVAQGRVGEVLQAQGKLEAAQEAFGECLAISRRLAEQDPSNAGWQRDLAVAQGRVGDVLEAQGKLEAAQEAFREYLAISRRLAEKDPGNAGWQRELSVAQARVGNVLQVQGKLEAAQEAFRECLTISQRLAKQDPGNAGWQRELAVARGKVSNLLQAQGKLEAAQEAFGECLTISRRLAEQDPGNARWQRDLAVAQGRMGDVLQAQGKLEAAKEAYGDYLAISRRLAKQDPGNAGWQRELAVAQARVGSVLEARGNPRPEEAKAAITSSTGKKRGLAFSPKVYAMADEIAEQIESLEKQLSRLLQDGDARADKLSTPKAAPKRRIALPKKARSLPHKSAEEGKGTLRSAVVAILKKSKNPLKTSDIYDALVAQGYKFTFKEAKKVLGIRLYKMLGVKPLGGGIFQAKERRP